jgi:hypothetical protein
VFSGPRFNEFVVRVRGESPFGLPLERYYPELAGAVLLCVTETARRQEIDAMITKVTS